MTRSVSFLSFRKMLLKGFAVLATFALLWSQAQAQAIELIKEKAEAPAWQRVKLEHNAQPFEFAAYANHDLAETDFNIKEIVVVLHGVSRDGNNYFASAQSTLNQVHLDQTYVLLVAPQFVSPEDVGKGYTGLPTWGKFDWASGLDALTGPGGLSSYEVMDKFLLMLADKNKYPSLRKIVFAGHSAGGQLVHRYAVFVTVASTSSTLSPTHQPTCILRKIVRHQKPPSGRLPGAIRVQTTTNIVMAPEI